MAIAHKETVSNDIGSTTTPDLTNISSPTSGDFALAGIVSSSTVSIGTGPSGWTPVADVLDGTDSETLVYYRVFDGSEGATFTDWITFNQVESGIGFVSAWTGVDATTPLDVAVVTESSGSSTNKDVGPITPTTAGAMLVALLGADPGAARSFTWDAGITPRLDAGTAGDTGYIAIGSKVWGGSGGESLGGDLNTADSMSEILVALRPAAAAAAFVPRVLVF